MSVFLTRDEVADLTGKVRFAAQVRVLSEMRIPFVINAANRPIVARATVERILGAAVAAPTPLPEQSRWKSAMMK